MSVTTIKSSAPQNYADFYQAFTPHTLTKEIFNDHPQDQLNAYLACCGRHVRNGLGDKVAFGSCLPTFCRICRVVTKDT